MRRRLFTIIMAASTVVIAVPLWAALTFETPVLRRDAARRPVVVLETGADPAPQRLSEAGSLAVTGILLLGLAAVVRRSSIRDNP